MFLLLDPDQLSSTPGFETGWRVTVTPTGWDTAVYVLAAGCEPASDCTVHADSGGTGEAEVFEVWPSSSHNRFLVVDGAAPGEAGPFVVELLEIQRPL